MNPINKKIIFLSGVSSAGKTSVLNSLKKLIPENSYIQISITRDFYKLKGISSEIEMVNTFTELQKKQFQIDYLEYYLEYTRKAILENNDCEYYIIDRSPLDIMAWTIYATPNLSHEDFEVMRFQVEYFFKSLKIKNTKVFLYSFPLFNFGKYLSWLTDKQSSDGFRFDPFGKNYLIDGILNNLQKLFTSCYVLNTSNVEAVDERANRILSFVNEY